MAETTCGFIDGPEGSGSDLLVKYGPTLKVDIGFDPAYNPRTHGRIPTRRMTGINALVDTGAGESCIDNQLAALLRLPIVDRRPISGVHGSSFTDMYLAQIHIPTLHFIIYGMFAGVDLIAGGQVHSALIGRTLLRSFTMTYEGRTGSVLLSSS